MTLPLMTSSATIRVTTGPDRGRLFHLEQELVHLGRAPENQIALKDPAVADHQASIVRRNGRYAICAATAAVVKVDGNAIPAGQWVWLPPAARIELGGGTSLQFDAPAMAAARPAEEPSAAPTPPPGEKKRHGEQENKAARPPRSKPSQQPAAPGGRTRRKVARFITDRGGDRLVALGEDGKLPELTLAEDQARAAPQRRSREGKPALLYVAVGFSLLASMLLLLIDADAGRSSAEERAIARQEITEYYGSGATPPAAWQRLLREARQAHSLGDRAAERRAYRRVLELLNSEDVRNTYTGLTGSRRRDERLRKLIGILLTE